MARPNEIHKNLLDQQKKYKTILYGETQKKFNYSYQVSKYFTD